MTVSSLIFISLFGFVFGGRALTPLLDDSHPCIAENLKDSHRYICDEDANVICLNGWREHEKQELRDLTNPCPFPICEWNNETCLHGECIRPDLCACEVGWEGYLCDKCVPLPGCDYGTCEFALECNCDKNEDGIPLYMGAFCDMPNCPDCNCNNGKCLEPFLCSCIDGWSGPNCDICLPLAGCVNGDCANETPGTCACREGWTGHLCDQPICSEGCNLTNGYCNEPNTCVCRTGWENPNCTQCMTYWDCPNGGTCIEPNQCICDSATLANDAEGFCNRPDINGPVYGPYGACSNPCKENSQVNQAPGTKSRSVRWCPLEGCADTTASCYGSRNWLIRNFGINDHSQCIHSTFASFTSIISSTPTLLDAPKTTIPPIADEGESQNATSVSLNSQEVPTIANNSQATQIISQQEGLTDLSTTSAIADSSQEETQTSSTLATTENASTAEAIVETITTGTESNSTTSSAGAGSTLIETIITLSTTNLPETRPTLQTEGPLSNESSSTLPSIIQSSAEVTDLLESTLGTTVETASFVPEIATTNIETEGPLNNSVSIPTTVFQGETVLTTANLQITTTPEPPATATTEIVPISTTLENVPPTTPTITAAPTNIASTSTNETNENISTNSNLETTGSSSPTNLFLINSKNPFLAIGQSTQATEIETNAASTENVPISTTTLENVPTTTVVVVPATSPALATDNGSTNNSELTTLSPTGVPTSQETQDSTVSTSITTIQELASTNSEEVTNLPELESTSSSEIGASSSNPQLASTSPELVTLEANVTDLENQTQQQDTSLGISEAADSSTTPSIALSSLTPSQTEASNVNQTEDFNSLFQAELESLYNFNLSALAHNETTVTDTATTALIDTETNETSEIGADVGVVTETVVTETIVTENSTESSESKRSIFDLFSNLL